MLLSKGATVYIIVFLVFSVGIWLIVEAGSAFLHAPLDISGNWKLVDDPLAANGSPTNLTIHQSGKYVLLQTDKGSQYDLRLVKVDSVTKLPAFDTLTFEGGQATLIATVPAIGATRFSLQSADKSSVWAASYRHPSIDPAAKAPAEPASSNHAE